MKLKIKQILVSVEPFVELQELKFPPKISMDIYKLGKELDKELEAYREMMKKIYAEYKVPESSGMYSVKGLDPHIIKSLEHDLNELVNVEVEIGNYSIPFEVFEQNNITISPRMLIVLEWLIKSDDPTDMNNVDTN
jgi:hypothetical protein